MHGTTSIGHRNQPRALHAALLAVLLLALLPGVARAGAIASLSVQRTQSLPLGIAPGEVASPLAFPNSGAVPVFPANAVLGAGDDGCPPVVSVTPPGSATDPTNVNTDQCDVFLRFIEGRHEDSPVAFPGITTKITFTGAPTKLTLHAPPGQLGNPFGAHQCSVDVELCDPNFPVLSPNVDNDPTEQDGSQVGEATLVVNGIPTVGGKILNYDPRGPDIEGDDFKTAPGALAVYIPPQPAVPDGVFEATPILVVPREHGDYGLDATLDLSEIPGVVNSITLVEYGLIPQAPNDPRQDPNEPLAALPFIFNPTSCVTATETADATFTDSTNDTASYQVFPDPNDAAPDDNERAFVEEECEGYPWNHRELDPARSTASPTGGVGGGPQNEIVTRDQPEARDVVPDPLGSTEPGFDGSTEVGNNDKVGNDDDAPVETPEAFQIRLFSPTRGGIPYQAHYKRVSLTLKDTTLSPALVGRPGFTICTPEQFDAGAVEAAECPDGSQIADLFVVSPLLDGDRGPVPCTAFATCSKVNPFVYADSGCDNVDPEDPCANLLRRFDPADWATGAPGGNLDPIGGEVWAGPQVEGHPNQFRVFAEITDGGITRIKIEGVATADKETGEIHAVFDDLPQLPVFHVEQAFPGGKFAPLVTPSTCGEHKFTTEVVPWTSFRGDGDTRDPQGPPAAEPDDSITTHAAPNAPCSGLRAFAPTLSLAGDPFTAGADTSLTTTITLPDRSDGLAGGEVSLPDGLLGVLNAVPMCAREQARAGTCPPESQIGTVDVAVGNGDAPLDVPGKVFFSQPGGDGELARITVVVPAKAGPFDLGETIVNELAVRLRVQDGRIGLDNVVVDPLPRIIAGIPIRVREIRLTIDHPQFLRNPLTCAPLQGTGRFTSAGGQTATADAPFQATGCETLAFAPKLDATLGSSEHPVAAGGHPSLSTVVTQPDHAAAIRKAVVTLPPGLFANVAALQTLCTSAQASANACPDGSRVGSAKAVSPLVPNPLTGSVFIAENPSGGLPRLVMSLTNDLLTVPLEATTTLTNNRLTSTFDNLPAAPVTSFELTIDGGPKGLLTVGNQLCGGAVSIDSTFESHTGQTASGSSPVTLVGSCVAAAGPAAAARPSLSVSLRHLTGAPLMTVRARSAKSGAKLRSVRLALPTRLVISRAALKRGVAITAGGKRLGRSSWSLSRSGVLTVKAPKGGSSLITATIQSGALRTNAALQRLARGRRALPRMTFTGRLVDVKNARYGYRLRVRPLR